jgi:murein DD-endopeptidase MepM/ murein hydrolase activator NlpD
MDGLLRRSRWRRSLRWRWLALAIAFVALGLSTLGGDSAEEDGAGTSEVPSDRLLPLVAPEVRGFAPVLEGSGFDVDDLAPARPSVPSFVEGEIGRGETLTGGLVALGVPAESLHVPVHQLGQIFDFRRSQVGDRYSAELNADGEVLTLRYQTSPERVYEARRLDEGLYEARQAEVELDVTTHTVSGVVEGSLIAAIVAAGESESLAREVVEVFQWDIDFSRDVRAGDAFRIVFEKVALNGEFLRYGSILAAEYRGARASQVAFLNDDPEHEGYFTVDGEPLQRMFLAAPCRHRRISSRFDPDRYHPVLQRRVPHNGVDYAADTGTPVYAVADAEVTFVGFRGRAGNLVRLRHAHGYETAYAHLSRFARGLASGDRVRQGELIGFVGNTGMSTGPHLHFGMKLRGAWVDPLAHQGSRGARLTGRALRDFQRRQSQLQALLDEAPIVDVARSEVPEEPELEEELPLHLGDEGYDDDL